MAKISLRAYSKEIDSLIDRGENAEAIAHCKFILKIYPKYIPTYSLLGKAYLESQRYSEALDIFQRVLSVYPDDFIAHLSLSIIREGEDNLDAAIFHMERAYEVQPANPGIQNELRRLYGRRDGSTPPRVRLTRGALVRMYERGELYRQAIAEIRAALAENPARIDLQVILCRMYFLAGQKVEATDIASQLIAKLPFCFEANRILAEILPGTSRSTDADLYKKRVLEIDPYYAFTSLSSPNSYHVADSSVQLDQLVYRMGEQVSDTGWAQNLGISLPGPSHTEELPDWFQSTAEPPVQTPTNATTPFLPAPTVEPEIPEFIRQAGFSASTGPEQPTTLETSEGEESENLATADIPDWLQSIAPQEPSSSTPITEEDSSWMAGLMASSGQSATEQPDNSQQSEMQHESKLESNLAGSELPDWLQGEISEESTKERIDLTSTAMPDWMSQPPVMPDRNELPEDVQPATEVPDWLQGLGDQAVASEEPQSTGGAPADSSLDWLQELSTPITPIAPLTTAESASDAVTGELPDWLSENQPEPENPSIAEASLPASEPEKVDLPDWLADLPGDSIEAPASAAAEKVETEGLSEEPAAESALPDWLAEIPGAPVELPTEAALETVEPEALSEEPAAEAPLPDWLADLSAAPIEAPAEAVIETKEPDVVSEEVSAETALPDWLSEIPDVPTQTLAQGAQEVVEPEALPAETALPDWLSEIPGSPTEAKAEAGLNVSEAEIVPEIPFAEEALPDWLAGLSVPTQESVSSAPIEPLEGIVESEEQPQTAELPDWLDALQVPPNQPLTPPVEEVAQESQIEGTAAVGLPDWLNEIDQPVTASTESELSNLLPPQPASEPIEAPGTEETETLENLALSSEADKLIPEQIGEPISDLLEQEAQAPTQPVAVRPSVVEPQAQPEVIETIPPKLETPEVSEESAQIDDLTSEPILEMPVLPVEEPQEPEVLVETANVESDAIPTGAPLASQEQPVAEEKMEPVSVSQSQPSDDMPTDLEAALAWMEALAARQGAVEGTLSDKAEQQSTEMPEWLQHEVENAPESQLPPPPADAETGAEHPEFVDQLQPGQDTQVLPESEITEIAEITPIPDDSNLVADQLDHIAATDVDTPPVDKGLSEESDWQQSISVEEPEELTPAEMPDWLRGVDENIPSSEPVISETEPESKLDEAWVREEVLPEALEPAGLETPVVPLSTEPVIETIEEIKPEIPVQISEPIQAENLLDQAQKALRQNNLPLASENYEELVNSGTMIEETIHDLRDAIDRHPMETQFYQILGDAYMRSNRLQDAIDAYTKAEQLLR